MTKNKNFTDGQKIGANALLFFKLSFQCFKNKKINYGLSIPKQETLLYQKIFLSFHHILYIELFLLKQNKSGSVV